MNRRDLLQSFAATSLAASSGLFVTEATAREEGGAMGEAYGLLDRYVEQFMREMNAPGMTLVLTDRNGTLRTASYGYGDREARAPVRPEQLFQIGSISKSFVGICLLQLRDEGKLDLHRPVVEYLPWLRIESAYAPVTAHHMLTHASGLPGAPEPFLTDPVARHRAAYAPGERFHYNNMAYSVLGHLAETLDGRELPEVIRRRVLEPLGMKESEPVITLEERGRYVKSYAPFWTDRPLPRDGRLCEAAFPIVTTGAGCVASTARDMSHYLRMIANRGMGPKGRLISAESFELFSKLHILDGAGPAGYGYGVFVDQIDGHPVVRHTGGMVSFSSSIIVQLDHGIAGFASINAQQGYRPTPVVQYALRLMAAAIDGKALPELPAANSPVTIENAAEYAGRFDGAGGGLEVVAEGDALHLLHDGGRVRLERAEGDRFLARHRDFERFPLQFGRKDPADPRSPVVEAAWGGDAYFNAAYSGPKAFDHPAEWGAYVGHYRNESPWMGSTRVVINKGRLMFDGIVPLEKAGDVFYLRDGPANTEWIRFGQVINGRCMHIKLSGVDLWRVAAD
jgi:D-alanyl-D-alanine carboxypeptidase